MKIDIREDSYEYVDEIRFASDLDCYAIATTLKRNEFDIGYVNIGISDMDQHCGDEYQIIASEEDALNLIKALEKAIELKWFDK